MSETVKSGIHELIQDLDADLVRFDIDKRGHISVELKGQDAEFAINFLTNEYGTSVPLENVKEGDILRGSLVDVGKVGYGLYADIGVVSKVRVDALIPLHRIRNQFQSNRPLRALAQSLMLVENLPVEVSIIDIDRNIHKIEAEFAQSTLDRIKEWSQDNHERLLVFGANQNMIEDALKKSSHLDDIYKIHELGKFEFALVCKRSTRASGIIAAIGPKLRGVPMHIFIPKEIGENFDGPP
ncbi:MAG: DUF2110 family protein [Candidatus Thorarchaeota archaeon]|nr:DUF2110 family protein [Candidatus Thorarchaeota archaeon]